MRNNGLLSKLLQWIEVRLRPWFGRRRRLLQVLALLGIRERLRSENLHDTQGGLPPRIRVRREPPPNLARRTVDGSFNDLTDPTMGMAQRRFTRNAPLDRCYPDDTNLLRPNPRVVSNELLRRDFFKPASTLNVLAAAWIQFQVHDWTSHGDLSKDGAFELEKPPGDDWHEDKVRILRSRPDEARAEGDEVPGTFRNDVTHWWDASQMYGSTDDVHALLREGGGGRLKMDGDLLPLDPRLAEKPNDPWRLDLTGVNENYWVGLSALHTLFAREHNAIAAALAAEYPTWDDEVLFDKARLINAALITKIHTVEWTTGILNTPALHTAMNGNWYGALRGRLRKVLGWTNSDMILGTPTSPTDHHGVPYSITEEFVSVYRLHALIPDDFAFHSLDGRRLLAERSFQDVAGKATRPLVEELGFDDLMYSMGTSPPGQITLHNFPDALRRFTRESGLVIDLAATDVLRDRERGVPRYNDFLELIHKPRVKRFEDLTPNPEWNAQIKEVYDGEIDLVDQHVGLMGEELPKGFGFSDTAFRIFILMASRRLKSDRFYTTDYNEQTYTKLGLEWIAKNTMSDVILRHHPRLARALDGVPNAFGPWTV